MPPTRCVRILLSSVAVNDTSWCPFNWCMGLLGRNLLGWDDKHHACRCSDDAVGRRLECHWSAGMVLVFQITCLGENDEGRKTVPGTGKSGQTPLFRPLSGLSTCGWNSTLQREELRRPLVYPLYPSVRTGSRTTRITYDPVKHYE
jgi:hypothetical protein